VWAARATSIIGQDEIPLLAQQAGISLPSLNINSMGGITDVIQDSVDVGVTSDEALQAHFDLKIIGKS